MEYFQRHYFILSFSQLRPNVCCIFYDRLINTRWLRAVFFLHKRKEINNHSKCHAVKELGVRRGVCGREDGMLMVSLHWLEGGDAGC